LGITTGRTNLTLYFHQILIFGIPKKNLINLPVVRNFLYLILMQMLLVSNFVFAQVTRITGKVIDSETREALPFVNIVFKNSNIGTATDFDGNFILITENPTDSLICSYVGYVKSVKAIKKGVSQNINFDLKPTAFALQEVVVKAGENPAHIILRKTIAKKDLNDREKLDAFQYEVYNKIEFDLNNIPEEYKNKKVFKPFSFIFDNIDSGAVGEKPYLPMFMTESLSDFYYKKEPKQRKEIIKASKVSGIENESVSAIMGDMYQNVNIYENSILVFGKSFVSPISGNGLFYYRYYLVDSMFLDNNWCYQLQFMPKRKQELTFSGNLWIHDTTFAVKRLEMKIAEDANINFVKTLNVIQDYDHVNGAWMLKKDRLVIDFAFQENKMGIYGRKTTSYKDFVINQPKNEEFYSKTQNIVVEEDASKKSNNFWEAARHDSLSTNEKKVYAMVDTIQSLPVYKTYVDIITIFVTGYKDFGKIEVGPYFNTYSFNAIEGHRFRLGGRTSNAFSKWYEINGYGAYGTKDEKFKYGLGVKSFITKQPRQIIYFGYKDDLEIFGQSQNAFTQDNILASLFRRNPLTNLTAVKQTYAIYEYEFFEGLNTKVSVFNRRMSPLGDFKYEFFGPDGTIQNKPKLVTSEARLLVRFAYDEKYINGEFTRVNLGSRYPVLQTQYTLGVQDVFKSDYEYHKFIFNVNDRFRINPLLGYTDYILEYGKIWGNLSYPLMELHGGNETYTYDPYAFNMMNYYEFASDEYGTVSVFHHFDGFFLNHVPLFRKLKWREVITGKALIGKVSGKNKQLLIFPSTLHSLNRGPYYEAGIGVENILKVLRIDAMWRLSYLDHPNISKFGIRGTLQVMF